MTLMFPNESRSYDATRRAIRFWGYDSAMEVSFFVTTDALCRLAPGPLAQEGEFLSTFDTHRPRICSAAERAYARHKKGSYELGPQDFPA